jgi:hypothetical protein
MLLPGAAPFKSNKIICCIRNPLDVIPSFASLSNTLSHSGMPEYKYDKDYPEWWDWWIRTKGKDMFDYFDILLRHCNKENKSPIYFVRYEDLLSEPQKELEGVMKFLLDVDDLTGTNCQRRIEQITAKNNHVQQATTYKLKPTTGKFNANIHMYNDE